MTENQDMELDELLLSGTMSDTEKNAMIKSLVNNVERMKAALKTIRESGWNEHPTAIWMQKVAAHAMEPHKWPEQPNQPPH